MLKNILFSIFILLQTTMNYAQSNQPVLNSKYAGVQIGVITYSYRSMPPDLESLIQHVKNSGISAIELMGDPVEVFLGRPNDAEEAKAWRKTVSMDEFKKVKNKLKDEGITVYAYKPGILGQKNSDEEYDFAMRCAKVLGAQSVTTELRVEDPSHSERLGRVATKNKIYVGYHNHAQGNDLAWNTAFEQSKYNSANLDCGHYIAAGGNNTIESLLAYIENNHDRISSLHVKDRKTKANGGDNLKWGEGDTPIKEILLLLKSKGYDIPVTIELEYKIPEGSNAAEEVRVCNEFARQILLD